MRKGLGMILLLAGIGVLVGASGAQATGCTASLTCSNACAEHLECASGVVISCSAPAQVISCTGTTLCGTGTNSVTCDGVTTTCKTVASRCAKDAVSIRCDATFKQCPTCGGKVCQSSPQPEIHFWDAPEIAAPAEASRCF